MKSEVEMVIKTGRQIVQKKQTENPKELDERVTALKLHYNELGAKVSAPWNQKHWLFTTFLVNCKTKGSDDAQLMS